MSIARVCKETLIAAAVLAAISGGIVRATPPSGTTSTLVGRGTFAEKINVKREAEDGWGVKVKAEPVLDVQFKRSCSSPGPTADGTAIPDRSSSP